MGKKNIICRYVDTFDYQTIVYVKLDPNTYRIRVLEGMSFIPFVSADELKKVRTVKDLSKLLGTELRVEDLEKIGLDVEPQEVLLFDKFDNSNVPSEKEMARAGYSLDEFKKFDIYGVADTVMKLSNWKRWINIKGAAESGKTTLAMLLAYLNCNEFMSEQVLYINWKNLIQENEKKEALAKSLNAIQNFCKIASEKMLGVPITGSGLKRPSYDIAGCRRGIRKYTIVIDDCYCDIAEEHPLLRIINEALKDDIFTMSRVEIPYNVSVITVNSNVSYSNVGTIDLEQFKLNIDIVRRKFHDSDDMRKMLKLLNDFREVFTCKYVSDRVGSELTLASATYLTVKDMVEYFECTFLSEIKCEIVYAAVQKSIVNDCKLHKTKDGLYEVELVDENKNLDCLEKYNKYLREMLKLLEESGLCDDDYLESVKKNFFIDMKEYIVEVGTSEDGADTSEDDEDTSIEKAAAFLDV